jgi:hypothetical protein
MDSYSGRGSGSGSDLFEEMREATPAESLV